MLLLYSAQLKGSPPPKVGRMLNGPRSLCVSPLCRSGTCSPQALSCRGSFKEGRSNSRGCKGKRANDPQPMCRSMVAGVWLTWRRASESSSMRLLMLFRDKRTAYVRPVLPLWSIGPISYRNVFIWIVTLEVRLESSFQHEECFLQAHLIPLPHQWERAHGLPLGHPSLERGSECSSGSWGRHAKSITSQNQITSLEVQCEWYTWDRCGCKLQYSAACIPLQRLAGEVYCINLSLSLASTKQCYAV